MESALSRSHAWLLTSKSQPWTCEGRGAPVPSRGGHSPRVPPPGLAPTSEVTRRPCEVCPPCHVTGLRAARLCAAAEPPSPARQHPVCTRLPPTRPPGAAPGFKQPRFGLRPGLGSHTQDRHRGEERDGSSSLNRRCGPACRKHRDVQTGIGGPAVGVRTGRPDAALWGWVGRAVGRGWERRSRGACKARALAWPATAATVLCRSPPGGEG